MVIGKEEIMHVENINYEYKNGLLVQLDGEDIEELKLMIEDLKKRKPWSHVKITIQLLEWLVEESGENK